MPDKGRVISQTYYEKQSKLFKLYRELFQRDELNIEDTIKALRNIGFSKTIAASRINEWKAQLNQDELKPETVKEKKHRQKQMASLEKYMFRMRLGKKKYDEYM